MKSQELHIFTTSDSVSVLMLVSCVLFIVGSIVSNAMIDQKPEQARIRAKQLAQQILSGGLKLNSRLNAGEFANRSLASSPKAEIEAAGRIGMDPWGHPYFYRVLDDKSDSIRVIVLSLGPDGEMNTDEKLFRADGGEAFARANVQGDDIAEFQ